MKILQHMSSARHHQFESAWYRMLEKTLWIKFPPDHVEFLQASISISLEYNRLVIGIIWKDVPMKFACILGDCLALHEKPLHGLVDAKVVRTRVPRGIDEDNKQWSVFRFDVVCISSSLFRILEEGFG